MTSSFNSPAAQKLLAHLTSRIAPALDIHATNDALVLSFPCTDADLTAVFADAGAAIDASLELPARHMRPAERFLMGSVEDLRFDAKTAMTGDGQRRLEVALHSVTTTAATHTQRLDSLHSLADSLFATSEDVSADEALVSYIVRRLNDRSDADGVTRLVADISGVLTNHLASKVKMPEDVAAHLEAATRVMR